MTHAADSERALVSCKNHHPDLFPLLKDSLASQKPEAAGMKYNPVKRYSKNDHEK